MISHHFFGNSLICMNNISDSVCTIMGSPFWCHSCPCKNGTSLLLHLIFCNIGCPIAHYMMGWWMGGPDEGAETKTGATINK